ncbi:EF-P beta-lysylation protein EpmB [Psittacicella gerlachiana]|uniref:L-lysine 2,3-aminomutase n=1 Tax=Psittacicella gerlachiana TaxID=2028574 RepID=A0A3A1YGG4_9GAMM|nr:EF-P beta-lysylation protein EpmB [Psittacicella gerlachiana]RIY35137.1 EF-P beta-lysylation protein EpmB [Psittacicella gerlachiana]
MISLDLEKIDNSWKRELAKAFKNPSELLEYLELDPQVKSEIAGKPLLKSSFPMLVPQFFADLMKPRDINDPLLLQVLPFSEELTERQDFVLQPLDEQDNFIPVANIVHKYQDRLLFLPKGGCAVNCRYCFRRNFPYEQLGASKQEWVEALNYAYQQHISELILSGGDPLMMTDKEFVWLFNQVLERNQTCTTKIDRIRIHSRLPIVLPQRITAQFIEMCQALASYGIKLIWVSHINHPQEISTLLQEKVQNLTKVGVLVLNQSVLLKGINDSVEVLEELSRKLFQAGILPYYLHLLDKVKGSTHFYLDDVQALELYAQLQTKTSGYLIPKLAREEVGKKHKTLYTA